MKVEGRVRAPEIGRVWLNSPPLSLRQLRGRVVLIDFWDYTCVNCIRTLPYLQRWHERYAASGLMVIGVHTPEFTFAQYESNVERGVREFGLTYPVVVDSNYELWKAFANRCWPAKYLIDKDGYVRYFHYGEGHYAETEGQIQELLLEANPSLKFPGVMPPLRAEDAPGAVCYQPTPELYLGNRRGRIANEGGFHEGAFDYVFPSDLPEDSCAVEGRWSSTAEYLETAGTDHRLVLRYSAGAVNLVMASHSGAACDVILRQDGAPLPREAATADVEFRDGDAHLAIERARMYALVDNHSFGERLLELSCRDCGLALYAFTFTSCVAMSS